MKKLLPLLLFPLFSSCTHYYYAPNMHNVPLFQQQYDARLDVSAGTGDEYSSTEVQAAFAATKNIGVMVNYIHASGGSGLNNGSGNLAEVGAGYYRTLGAPSKKGGRGVFEVYGGYGGGTIRNQYDSLSRSSMKLSRFFIQPDIGYTGPYFDIAFSPRFTLLHYRDVTTDGVLPTQTDAEDVLAIYDHPTKLLLEPAVTVRGGYKFIKVQLQLVTGTLLSGSQLRFAPSNLNIGFYLSLDQRWNKVGGASGRK